MSAITATDVYRAAYGMGQAQAAGPLPQTLSRTALIALSRVPDVSIGEMMRHFWQGVSEYYDARDLETRMKEIRS